MKNIFKSKIFYIVLFLIILLLAFPKLFLGCKAEEKMLSEYTIDAIFNSSDYTLSCQQKIDYFNRYDNMFESLYFHLYPNAFREDAKESVVSSSKEEAAYPNGESYGNIQITSVLVGGEERDIIIEGDDQNILKVELGKELYPDEQTTISISYIVNLANISHRLGYCDNTINFGNFYPIACVYEEGKGFCMDLYSANGDPFYSESANYNVSITREEELILASTGNVVKDESGNGRTTTVIRAEKVRDFCFVLSDKFEVAKKAVDGIEVRYYGYKGDSDLNRYLQTSVDALSTFSEMYGIYPYKQLSVVKSNFVYGGMEYPNLVLISDEIDNSQDVNYVIVHEVAHQWWYSVVGNDEYNNPWQDEAITEYSTMLFFERNESYGEDYQTLITQATNSYKLFEKIYKKVYGEVDGSMNRSLDKYQTEPEYVQCVYTKGVLMYDSLRQLIGQNKFLKALKHYFQTFKYQNALPENLIASFTKYGGDQIEGFFSSWLSGEVVIT